jgi:hypothetical protein
VVATVRAILRHAPADVTLVARGRSNGTIRADEDELCALYLRARLEGRQPDVTAIRAVLATPPPNPTLVAVGAYDLKDREIAAEVDAIAFAISVRRERRLLIAGARPGRARDNASLIFATDRCPALYGHAPCIVGECSMEVTKCPICHSRERVYRIEYSFTFVYRS